MLRNGDVHPAIARRLEWHRNHQDRQLARERLDRPLQHRVQLAAVLACVIHDVGDDVQRQPKRDVVHEIALVCIDERADDVTDAFPNAIFELGDAAGREAFVDQLPQLRVDRRVLTDEQVGHSGVAVFRHLGVVIKEYHDAYVVPQKV